MDKTHITTKLDESDSSSSNNSTRSILSPQLNTVATYKQESLGNHESTFAENFHPLDTPEAQIIPPPGETNKYVPPNTRHNCKKDGANLPPTKSQEHYPTKTPSIYDPSSPLPDTLGKKNSQPPIKMNVQIR